MTRNTWGLNLLPALASNTVKATDGSYGPFPERFWRAKWPPMWLLMPV